MRAYAEMLSRLEAEDSLRRLAEIQAADSFTERAPRERVIEAWRRQAGWGETAETMTREEFIARMAAMGLKFEG